MRNRICQTTIVTIMILVLSSFMVPHSATAQQAENVPVEIDVMPLTPTDAACSGQFVTHPLDHITTVPGGDTVRMFEANGGGVGINDLDNDGDLDVVLANHADANSILWNEGALNFRVERLTHGDSRAVSIIDVDGDGWQDMVFTRTASSINYWHNEGQGQFALEVLPGISEPLYTINWFDADLDGDLDLIGASYDAALLTALGQEFLASGRGGVYYYENRDGSFRPQQLAPVAQSLALMVTDLNHDERLDIIVGNDFAVPDGIWYGTADGWQAAQPFDTTSRNTMSFDAGDIDNDGRAELFSTDMMPYQDDAATHEAWQPIMAPMEGEVLPMGDPQHMTNTLQMIGETGQFINTADERGVDATGWSWSGKFGDLDQDGLLDLYVVNGFIEMTMLAHLDNHELVEANQVFRNTGGGMFEPFDDWNLGSTESGRGMSMGDLDLDGDLDIVVNNLRGPAQLFENQLCAGHSLQVDLQWSGVANHHALGSTVILQTDHGTYSRQSQAVSGYLSGNPSRIHFGFPVDATLEQLEVHWPDGAVSIIATPPAGSLVTIVR